MVECQLPKLDVAGSNPVSRSIFSTTWENFFNGLLQNCSIYIGPSAVSNAFTASRRLCSEVLVYTFSLTSTVWPICSARTWGSTSNSFRRQLWVRRVTWKFTQERPAALKCGAKCRRQQLSLIMGVLIFSDGNTHASGRQSTERLCHFSTAA